MTQPTTYVAIVLDQSGSMAPRRSASVESYNEQVQQAKLNSKDQRIFCSLLTFNGDIFEHLWNVPADELMQSTDDDYVCDGGTALNDAVGYVIEKFRATTDVNDPNNSYLIQVVTDGDENSSRQYPKYDPEKRLKRLIESCQETKRWTFSFMGCDGDYLKKLSEETAVPISNMAAWSPSNARAGLKKMSDQAGQFYRARASGQQATSNYHSPVHGLSADYTAEDESQVDAALLAYDSTGGAEKAKLAAGPKVNCFANHKAADWSHRSQPSSKVESKA